MAGFFKQLDLTNDTFGSLRKECVLECTNSGKQQRRNGYSPKLADLPLECTGGGKKKKEAKNKKSRCYSFHMCL